MSKCKCKNYLRLLLKIIGVMDIHDNSCYSFPGKKPAAPSEQDIRYPFSNRTGRSVGADQRIRTLTRITLGTLPTPCGNPVGGHDIQLFVNPGWTTPVDEAGARTQQWSHSFHLRGTKALAAGVCRYDPNPRPASAKRFNS